MHEKQLTWDLSWINSYESIWSIFNKIKIANCVSHKEICNLLINLENKVSFKYIKNNKLSILFNGFNTKTTILININLCTYQQELKKRLLKSFIHVNNDYSSFFSDRFAFCPICANYDYHSIFHQFVFLNICPFHNEPLSYIDIDNVLIQNSYENIFPMNTNDSNFFISSERWKSFRDNNTLLNKDLNTLISLNSKSNSKQRVIYFNNSFLKTEEKITKIVSVFRQLTKLHNDSKKTTFTSPPIKKFHKKFEPTNFKEINKLYFSTYQTFRAISRNIRKNYLIKHKKCLRNFTKQHPEKEYALSFVYVNWRMFIEGVTNSSDLENGKRAKRKYHYITVASKQDNDYMVKLFHEIFNRIDKKYWTETIVHWFMNRLLGIIIMYHYKKWNELSITEASLNYRYHFCPFNYEHIPPILIEVTSNPKEIIKIHVWD